MKYVMADIHGDYDKYIQMLELIQLKDEDELYILGDVIDRGPCGMKILQDMMLRPNVIPILGNHEYMASIALAWLSQEVTEESVEEVDSDKLQGLVEWMNVGGEGSIAEFQKLSQEEQQDILEYLEEFALYDVVEAGGKEFVLVHAGLDHFSKDRDLEDYDLSELIFQKPDYEKVYFKDKYLVTGHTPTWTIYAQVRGILLKEIEMNPKLRWDRIYTRCNHVAIDCGCGYGGRLGCVCLDTMERYYI